MGKTLNPHWIGNEPAWDIEFDDGSIARDVTQSVILRYAWEQGIKEGRPSYDLYGNVVREIHIQLFCRRFAQVSAADMYALSERRTA